MTNKMITKHEYGKRIGYVIDYIHDHLDDVLSLEVLANVACLSPYHWHRIYQSITSETLSKTVRRLRLQRAAKQLVEQDISIDRIAKRAGYTNTDSFTRKFSADYAMSPTAYRKRGKYIMQKFIENNISNERRYDVEIAILNDINLVTMDHSGNYLDIGRTFEKLFAWGGRHGALNHTMCCYAVYMQDPNAVDKSELRSKAGFTYQSETVLDKTVNAYTVKGGRYAKIVHKGPYSELEMAYRWLYGAWLLDSGEEPDDKPVVEEYLNNPKQTLPSELLTAIYLPIK